MTNEHASGTASPDVSSSTFSAADFFATQEAPARLPQLLDAVSEFVAHHAHEKRRVVLVTVSLARAHGARNTSAKSQALTLWPVTPAPCTERRNDCAA